MMKWTILIYVSVIPYIFLPGVHMRMTQQLAYQLGSVIVFAIGLFVKQKAIEVSAMNNTLAAGIAAFVVAWVVSMNGWLIGFNYICAILVYLTIIRTMDKEDSRFIVKGLAWISLLVIIWLALQLAGYDIRGATLSKDIGNVPNNSFFGQKAVMGSWFALVMPLFLGFSWLGVLLLIPLWLSFASGPILGAITGMIFYWWNKKRILAWIALVLMIPGFILFVWKVDSSNESGNGRFHMWSIVLNDAALKPLGYGLDSFADPMLLGAWRYVMQIHDLKTVRLHKASHDGKHWKILSQSAPPQEIIELNEKTGKPYMSWDHPHSEYLWIGYELGHMGWIIFGFLVYFIFQRFRRSRRERETVALMASLISLLFVMLTQFPFHVARVGNLVPVILGFFYLWTEPKKVEAKE